MLRGNPSKRPLPRREPKPAGPPILPALPAAAEAEWHLVVGELASVPGLLTVADRATLEVYSRTMARWRALEAFVEAHGPVLVLRDDRGAVRVAQPSPHAALAAKLLPQLRGLAGELGLSPAARTRLEVEGPAPVDATEAFLRSVGSPSGGSR